MCFFCMSYIQRIYIYIYIYIYFVYKHQQNDQLVDHFVDDTKEQSVEVYTIKLLSITDIRVLKSEQKKKFIVVIVCCMKKWGGKKTRIN